MRRCEQCIARGTVGARYVGSSSDYRPGLPLEKSCISPRRNSAYSATPDGRAVQRMQESRCYIGSNKELDGISSHDPHKLPEPSQRVAYYQKRCLDCTPIAAVNSPRSIAWPRVPKTIVSPATCPSWRRSTSAIRQSQTTRSLGSRKMVELAIAKAIWLRPVFKPNGVIEATSRMPLVVREMSPLDGHFFALCSV